jgi:hypothetical protein
LALLDDDVDVPELAADDGTHGCVGHVRRVADTISLRARLVWMLTNTVAVRLV